jgi:hypothetical protein
VVRPQSPRYIKVDYSGDDQWNRWVKIGVRKLVSVDDGVYTKMADRTIANNQYCLPFPGTPNDQWAQSATVKGGPLANSFASPANHDSQLHGTWDAGRDIELNESGSDLLQAIGWEPNTANHHVRK